MWQKAKFQRVKNVHLWIKKFPVSSSFSSVPRRRTAKPFGYFNGECTEVGMYLAMSRVAYREGYAEIGEYWRRAALEEAEHAAK